MENVIAEKKVEVNEFLQELRAMNLFLIKDNDKLILKGAGKLTHEETKAVKQNKNIISYIKENKDQLLSLLSQTQKSLSNESVRNIESIYRLSGLQEGMLFHSLYADDVKAYIRAVYL